MYFTPVLNSKLIFDSLTVQVQFTQIHNYLSKSTCFISRVHLLNFFYHSCDQEQKEFFLTTGSIPVMDKWKNISLSSAQYSTFDYNSISNLVKVPKFDQHSQPEISSADSLQLRSSCAEARIKRSCYRPLWLYLGQALIQH